MFRTIEPILNFFNIPLNETITDPTTIEVIQTYAKTDLTGSNIDEMFQQEMDEMDEDQDQDETIEPDQSPF